MSSFKRLFFVILPLILLSEALFADELHNRDFELITSYINSKRTIDYGEKRKNLKLSGDTRAQLLYRNESGINRIKLRGGTIGDRFRPSHDTFEAIFNLRIDYECGDKTWAKAYLQFDNEMGIEGVADCDIDPQACAGSGECDDLCVKRAYWGINVWRGPRPATKLDIEVGRRPLYVTFDSRIQFHARFDGILFDFQYKLPHIAESYVKGGPFVVDYRINHYAYAVEGGLLDFMDQKIDIKYSFIDWKRIRPNRCGIPNPRGWRFRNSQWTLGYNFITPRYKKKGKIYAAFLVNHAAERLVVTHNSLANIGWYAGFIIGEVKKKNDWSVDINYQYVQAQAISDCDVHGIGRGNVLKESFASVQRGKANYQGWHFETLYALTDKLSFDLLFEFSRDIDGNIGGRHRFQKTEFDVICAF